MPASRRNQSTRPAKPRSVASVFPTARDIWLKARRRVLKATAAPVAAAALVFPSLMDPAPAVAQSYDLVESDGTVVLGDLMPISGSMGIGNTGQHYLVFQKMINGGVGFDSGYSAIGMHTTLYDWGTTHLFNDTRVQITDHSRVGANTLFGLRRVVGEGVIGGWVGLDTWESHNGFRYEQIAFGGEALFNSFDLRGAYYMPLDDDANFVGFTGFGTAAPTFSGRNLVFLDPALAEEAVSSWSVEAGIPTPSQAARFYAGVYGVNPDLQDSAVGASGRIEVRATNDLTFSFNGSYDDVYDGNFNILAEWRFSGTPNQSGFLPCFDCNYRRHGQVRRDWIVKTADAAIEAERAALHPVTMQPLIFAHVNNTNGAAGTGTFENPYQALPNAAANADYILVDRGVGVTSGNIVLQPGQRMLGEGKPMIIDTKRGMIVAPGYDTTGAFPTLSPADPTAPVITIADDAVVRGFNFIGPATSTAIAGNAVDNFLIECVYGTIGNGVVIADGTGTGIIRDADFTVLDQFGYSVGNNGGSLDLTINDVIATTTNPGSIAGVNISTTGGSITAALDAITLDGFADAGMLASVTNGTLDLDASNVDVLNTAGTAGDGFRVESTNSTANVNLADITATGAGDGVFVDSTDSQIAVNVSDAVLDMGMSGVVLEGDTTTGTFDASNITATNAGVDGVRIAVDEGSDVTSTLADIDVTGAGDNGLDLRAEGMALASMLNVTATNITADDAGTDAIALLSNGGSTLTATMSQVSGQNAGLDGLNADADGGDIVLNATDLTVTNAGDDGVDISASNGGNVTGSMTTVAASNATAEGLAFDADSNGSINMSVTDATAVGSGTNGLLVDAGDAGSPGTVNLQVNNGDFTASTDTNVVISAEAAGSMGRVTANGLIADSSATGNGIEVTATTGGAARLIGTDVSANNNAAGSGMVLDSNGAGSSSVANLTDSTFSNNALDGVNVNGAAGSDTRATLAGALINNNTQNGIEVDLDGAGTTGRVDLSSTALNATNIQNSGFDAIDYNVTNGADFAATGDGVVMTGSGRFGFDGSVQGAGSNATVNFINTDAGDQTLGGTDLDVGTIAGGANQVFRFENGSLDNTGGDGINGDVDNNSTLGITIVGSDLSNNAGEAAQVAADNNSTGRLTMDNVDASNAGANGILVSSDNGSLIDLDLNIVDASGAAVDGLEILAATGGEVDADIDTLNVSNSGVNGLQLSSMDANTNIDLLATNVIGDSNQAGGLDSDTLNGGTTTAQFFGGSFSNNGLGGPTDGVNVRTNGTDSLADFCFDGTAADSNDGVGYHFEAEADSTLIANLQTSGAFGTLSADNNSQEGLRVDANGADTVIVTMSGANSFANNGVGNGTNGVTFDYLDVDNVGVQFSGSVTGADADGLNINIVNALNAAVQVGDPTLLTPSDFTGNGDDGIDVTVVSNTATPTNMDDFTVPLGKQAGFTFGPFDILNNNASSNTSAGINVLLDNVFIAAGTTPQIDNNIASNNLGGDGITLAFNDSNIPGTFSISDNTANTNADWGIDVKLTSTVLGDLQANNNTTNSNTSGGARIFIDPSIIQSGSMDGHTSLNNGGDGVQLLVDDSQLSNFTISNGLFQSNAGRGVNVEAVNGSTIDALSFSNNLDGIVTTANFAFALANPNTNRFTLQNTSTVPAIQLTNFLANIGTATTTPLLWDTTGATATPFQPLANSDVTTGLATVNGTAITAGTNPLQDGGGTALADGGVPDNQGLLNLAFTDFDQFETLAFQADVDTAADPDFVPTVADLIGTFVNVSFSNGATLSGQLIDNGAGGLTLANVASLSNIGMLNNTLEGIRLAGTDSTFSNVSIDATRVDGNQSTGIDIVLVNSNLTGSSISGSFIENNAGDGIRLDNPTTMGAAIELDITDTTIQSNTGAGFTATLAGTEQLNSDLSGNTISNNTSFGYRLDQEDNSTSAINFGSVAGTRNTVTGNGDAGIGVSLSDNALTELVVENTTITGTTNPTAGDDFDGDGIRVTALGNSTVSTFRVGDPGTPGDVIIANNVGDGVALEVQGSAVSNAGPEIYNATISGNRDGVALTRTGNAALDNILIQDTTITGNFSGGIQQTLSGTGLDVTSAGGALPLVIDTTINNSQIDGNFGNGLGISSQNEVLTNYVITDSSFSNNIGDGIEVLATNAAGGSVTNNTVTTFDIDDTTIDGNTGTGFDASINLNGTLNVTIDGSSLNSNTTGIAINTVNAANATLTVGTSSIDESEVQAVLLNSADTSTITATFDTVTMSDGADGLNLIANAASTQTLTGTDLFIEDGTGDGITITSNGTSNVTASLTDASVQRNDGYGLFSLNTADADQNLTIAGTTDPLLSQGATATSTFSGNGLAGIRIQNGATIGQGLNTDNNILFNLSNTAANGNGLLGTVAEEQAGLIVQVGTSTSGSVISTVDRNTFFGNAGTDVIMTSFTAAGPGAALDPAVSAAYTFDSLARLSLAFTNNQGNGISVTEEGAIHNNLDVFKSSEGLYGLTGGATQIPRVATRVALDVTDMFNSTAQAGSNSVLVLGDPMDLPDTDNRFDRDWVTMTSGGASGESRPITVYNGPTRQVNIPGGSPFTGVVAAGDTFRIDAIAQNGLGASTFITQAPSLAAGSNAFTSILSDFGDIVLPTGFTPIAADVSATAQAQLNEGFGWDVNAAAGTVGFVFPTYLPTVLGDDIAPFTDMTP